MATRVAVKEEAESIPRLIWQEVEDEMSALKTCLGAVEGLEMGENLSNPAPISTTFFNSLNRLENLQKEIMENFEEVKKE